VLKIDVGVITPPFEGRSNDFANLRVIDAEVGIGFSQ
jgi:hypothetical protein